MFGTQTTCKFQIGLVWAPMGGLRLFTDVACLPPLKGPLLSPPLTFSGLVSLIFWVLLDP
jgi:hypothetical protein